MSLVSIFPTAYPIFLKPVYFLLLKMDRILFMEEIKSLSQIFSVSYMKPSFDSNT